MDKYNDLKLWMSESPALEPLSALRRLAGNRLRRQERSLLRWVDQQHDAYCARGGRQLSAEQKRLCDELPQFHWPDRPDLSWEDLFLALTQWGELHDGIPELGEDGSGLAHQTSQHGWVELGHFFMECEGTGFELRPAGSGA